MSQKKLDPFSFEHNFGKYCPILIILSLLQTKIICPQTCSLTVFDSQCSLTICELLYRCDSWTYLNKTRVRKRKL